MFLMLNITDILAIFFLVFLEGVLSLDNALVLALMVRHLPPEKQKKALTYGIWGAFAFRFVSLFFLTKLMGVSWIKWVGGGYLIWMAAKNLFFREDVDAPESGTTNFSFWRLVFLVELMDVAFSVDSILAAVSLTQNYMVVMAGGILGIIMMRFAAMLFIGLIKQFPRLEQTAYWLVAVIGVKLFVQGFNLSFIDFHSATNIAAWLFWGAMILCITYGFKRVPVKK